MLNLSAQVCPNNSNLYTTVTIFLFAALDTVQNCIILDEVQNKLGSSTRVGVWYMHCAQHVNLKKPELEGNSGG